MKIAELRPNIYGKMELAYRDMTDVEEAEAMNAENESVKTPEERIAELEAMLNALISGRTEP